MMGVIGIIGGMGLMGLLCFHLAPCGRVNSEEVLDEEVEALVLAVGLANGVVGTGDNDEFKRLVGLDEGVGDLHGAGRIDVVIQFTYNEH